MKSTAKSNQKPDQSKTIPIWIFYLILGLTLVLIAGLGYYFWSKYSANQANLPFQQSEDQAWQQTQQSENTTVLTNPSDDAGASRPTATVSPTRNLEAVAPANASADFILGDAQTADVTIIEYMDLNCSHCKDFHKSLKTVNKEFGNQLAWVVRHYPVLGSAKRAAWMECVGSKQGEAAYWEFMDRYFAEITSTAAAYDDQQFNIWLDKYGYSELSCDQEEMLAKVTAQWNEGNMVGVAATPTSIFVTKSGEKDLAMGAMSAEDLRQVIRSYLPN